MRSARGALGSCVLAIVLTSSSLDADVPLAIPVVPLENGSFVGSIEAWGLTPGAGLGLAIPGTRTLASGDASGLLTHWNADGSSFEGSASQCVPNALPNRTYSAEARWIALPQALTADGAYVALAIDFHPGARCEG